MRKLLLAGVAAFASVGGIGFMGSAMAQTVPAASQLSPGSITVRLNGRVNWYAGVEGSTLDNNSATGEKTSTDNFLGYMRLYPGFDGVAANGLHYGAAAEIRMNGGQAASSETLYVFQAYGYLGLPELGQVSFGQENGPSVLFETGTFEGFNDGGWNGDIEGMIPGNAIAVYPFPDSGSAYDQASSKIVYLSPTFGGLQLAVGFTPNQTAENTGPVVTSSATPIAGGMPRNMIDVGGQYTNKFGPLGVQIGLDYTNAGQVANTGDPDGVTGYKQMSILSGGATVSYAGFTVGGNSSYGAFNMADGDTFQLEPDGGTAAVGWLVGGMYTTGPLVVGASFFRFNQTGDLPGGIDAGSGATITSAGLTTGQQQNTGVAAGLTYTLVPGVNLFADYLYGVRQQGGYNFATGNAGTDNNQVQSQLFGVGTQIQW
ncbi:porin [Acidisoma cellulosilytica]|uniref:Porin n=1 Tax=Acidisoma cellulosilyticum TaxID=2802395 RepID=A0A964E591_9PROT|nr:porin [Acidisoma cellulosilyticum]MCB8882167.1 porin [Acidisoma cellulosilyticum]